MWLWTTGLTSPGLTFLIYKKGTGIANLQGIEKVIWDREYKELSLEHSRSLTCWFLSLHPAIIPTCSELSSYNTYMLWASPAIIPTCSELSCFLGMMISVPTVALEDQQQWYLWKLFSVPFCAVRGTENFVECWVKLSALLSTGYMLFW